MNNAMPLTALLSSLIIFRTSRTEPLMNCTLRAGTHPFYRSQTEHTEDSLARREIDFVISCKLLHRLCCIIF